MIDLEAIEHMANTCDAGGHVVPCATVLALVAEVRRLRAILQTPVLTAGYSPYHGALVGLEGAHRDVAHDVFYNSVKPVTVFYGEKRIYTTMAEFCAAHPEAKS